MGFKVVGTWRQIVHWRSLVALSAIFTNAIFAIRCAAMRWPPLQSIGGFLNFVIFLSWVVLTLYNYFMAMFKGPGFVPLGWKPTNCDAKYLQYCDFCKGYKAPRSHHCRKCDRCVMKMDHHCSWINTCCGHFNQGNFVFFLFFTSCGCIHALCIFIPTIYKAINFHYYIYNRQRGETVVYLTSAEFVMTMFSIGLAIGCISAVGILFYLQMRSILKNETLIESWIVDKANDRERTKEEGPFVYPYNLGHYRNMQEVFTWTGKPRSDGFIWSVLEGCSQYTLTLEQIRQKTEKRKQTVQYLIVEEYSGCLFPCTKGAKVTFCIPCTDEPRIILKPGDKVLVTRWEKHWLYGTKILSPEEKHIKQRVRGWFPRKCAGKKMDDNENVNDKKVV